MAALLRAPEPEAHAAPLDAAEAPDLCTIETVRIPHITVEAFWQTEAFAATWARVAADRRMVSAAATLSDGGLQAAVAAYGARRSPDLIIVETDLCDERLSVDLDALADVCAPNTALIVVGHANDIALYQRLVGLGVSDYLVHPASTADLIGAIDRIYHEPGRDKIGRIHAFVGASGGAGASTIAQNVADCLGRANGADALLVDLDLTFGSACVNLNVEPNQGLAELMERSEPLDTAMLDRVLVRRGLNLNILATGGGLDQTRDPEPEAVERVLDVCGAHIPHIVLDLPHAWTAWAERALTLADTVTIVAQPELACLRNAATVMTRLRALRPNDRAPRMVLNHTGMPRRQEIGARDIADVLKVTPALSIPHDPRLFSRASAEGKTLGEITARRPASKAITALADLLAPRQVPRPRRKR